MYAPIRLQRARLDLGDICIACTACTACTAKIYKKVGVPSTVCLKLASR